MKGLDYAKKLFICFTVIGFTFAFCGYSFADLNDGLVAYYPFNGNANDESGNGNDGTVNGATLTEDRCGNANSAYSFDGADDYIDIGNTRKTKLSDYYLSAWIHLYDLSRWTHYRRRFIFRNDYWDSFTYNDIMAIV